MIFAFLFHIFILMFSFFSCCLRYLTIAYLSGVKANFGTIGVSASVPLNDCLGENNTAHHVESIAKWAQDFGMSTGEYFVFLISFFFIFFFLWCNLKFVFFFALYFVVISLIHILFQSACYLNFSQFRYSYH